MLVVSRVVEVVWRVVAQATPQVTRHCPRCAAARPFASSDKFRINAQKRRLDVWLIYRCASCEATWNCEVMARCLPEDLAPDLYRRLLANDSATAWAHAFDQVLLARAGARADLAVPYRVDRPPLPGTGSALVIALELAHPCAVRLDRLLAAELGVARARLPGWVDAGLIRVEPGDRHALRRPVRTGQRIEVAREVLAAGG